MIQPLSAGINVHTIDGNLTELIKMTDSRIVSIKSSLQSLPLDPFDPFDCSFHQLGLK